jgi:DNA-binding transcriptional regulator YiaG
MKKLSAARRKKVEDRAAQLISQEMSLRDLRKARSLTQERVAEILETSQDGVSRQQFGLKQGKQKPGFPLPTFTFREAVGILN